MANPFIPRINITSMIALSAIVIAVTVLDLAVTQRMPDANTATNLQLKKDLAEERIACERWGARAGSENFDACIADLNETRVKHDRRHVNDLGNRRDGLTITF